MRNTSIVPIVIALALLHLVGGCAADLELTHQAGYTQVRLKTSPPRADQSRNATDAAASDGKPAATRTG
jgi:hypothetical protein